MTKRAQLPDGTILEFPDDTPDAVMDRVVKAQLFNAGAKPAPQKPDFSDVRGGSSPTKRAPFERGQSLGARALNSLGAAIGMGDEFEQFGLGLGRNIDRTYRGGKQLLVDSLASQSGLLASGLEAVGMRAPARAVARNVTVPLARVADRERVAEVQNRRVPNAGPAMTAGDITGTVGSLLGPGALLRGTAAAPVFLPRTLLGNALQGGVIGAAQPVAEEGERGLNTGVGLGAGYVGAAIPRVVGGAINGVRGLLPNALTSADRRAGAAILSEATNPGQLTVTPSAVAGAQRTLGEATLDPGIMALENTLRSQNPAMFTQIDRANNAARMGLLGEIAGTDAELLAAQQARDTAAMNAKTQAMSATPVDIARTLAELDTAIANTRGRSAVQPSLQALRNRLASYADSGGRVDVATLDNVRQDIGDMLAGKFGGDASAALRGARELIGVRDAMNQEIGGQVPAFTDYLNAYRGGSGPINRMEVGRELLDRAGQVPDPVTGMRTLTPFQFSKAMNDLDAVAAEATQFNKAKAADILAPEQMTNLRAIQDDLARVYARANTRPAGSPTYGLQEAGKRLAVRSAARAVPMLGGAVDFLEQQATQRMQQRLAYLVANPTEAQRVLQALQPRERALLSSALAQFSRTGGALAPALTE